jgi:hypothetical protein
MKHNERKPKLTKTKTKTKASPAAANNELGMQNAIRKRYCDNWPDTILQLTKRVQSVNQTWTEIIVTLMRIPGLRISWYRDDKADNMIVEVRYTSGTGPNEVDVDEVELHEITAEELARSMQYLEVLFMDKLKKSELIARVVVDWVKRPKPELPG